MSNVTVQEALKAAIEEIENYGKFLSAVGVLIDATKSTKAINQCKAALAEIEKCEPVAEAIRERDRLGFAVVNVIGKLDEIIENTQEVEIDDFLHIAVPIDMWNELQSSLEDMPKRADLYTSPQPRDWVGLTYKQKVALREENDWYNFPNDLIEATEAKLKQLNAEKG